VVCGADNFGSRLVEIVFVGDTPSSVGDGVVEGDLGCGSDRRIQDRCLRVGVIIRKLSLGLPNKDRSVSGNRVDLSISAPAKLGPAGHSLSARLRRKMPE
jgi:hypothetical protein